ncbi:hypothetical protein [Miltoncostaea marina]|uniref:hypothetical protein n=1 Tax=Miltoncostaea marina TaxID=2843215 RepID=UPI001C3E2B4A|nr:hypothetical protein [Miltoncostaea marina]
MRSHRPLTAVVAAAVAATLIATGATAATAAPTPAKPSSQQITLVRQISKLDGQYTSLRKRVRTCATARSDLRVADRQRRAAKRSATVRRPVRVLRAKRVKMAAAVLRLNRRARLCATARRPVTPVVQAVPGAAGTAQLRMPDVVTGASLDLGSIIGSVPLGDVVRIVDVLDLDGVLCSTTGVTCVGVDGALLRQALNRLLSQNLVTSLLSLDLPGTIAAVQALLAGGDVTSLLRAEVIDGSVLRLIPLGPLAQLAGVGVIPDLPVGAIRVVP